MRRGNAFQQLRPFVCYCSHIWSVWNKWVWRCLQEAHQTNLSLTVLFFKALLILPRNFVEVRWRTIFPNTSLGKRCTSYNAPPTSRKRAADRWSLRNFLPRSSLFKVGKAYKSHGARSELNSVCGLEKVDQWNPIRTYAIQSRSHPMWFLGFFNHKKGVARQEISKWTTVCSTFSRGGWSVVRSASLCKGGTSKKRPSPHLQKQ
jgi:hypothetical protein